MDEEQRKELAEGEPSEQAKAADPKANPEVFDQPEGDEVVELNPAGTVIAKEQAPDPLDPDTRAND